jgi:peroxiredoxin
MSVNEENSKDGGMPKMVIAAIVVVVVAVVAYVVLGQREKFVPVEAGTQAVDFALPDLDGNMKSLKDFKGKIVFLNFWATWCAPCEEEMPSMQVLYDTFRNRGLEIVAVSVDSGDVGPVKEFAKKHGLTFTILHDRKGRVKESYKTTGVPETFIIDQNGIVAEKVWGAKDWNQPASVETILDLIENGPRTADQYRPRKAAN